MRLALLHGPSKVASRLKLAQLKNKFNPNQIIVFEEGISIAEIKETVLSISLLPEPRLVIAENVGEDFNFPNEQFFEEGLTLALWFDHEVSDKKTVMEWVETIGGTVLNFPEEKEVSVFPFLDLLAAKDKNAFLELRKLKTAGFDIYYLVTMVFYLLRNLTVTPKNAKEFMRKKLDRQRRNFNRQKLENLYQKTLEIDFKIKSGLLEQDQAEFLLVWQFLS